MHSVVMFVARRFCGVFEQTTMAKEKQYLQHDHIVHGASIPYAVIRWIEI